jgi:hypothetical protein
MQNSKFSDNLVYGADVALVYIKDALVNISSNTIVNNGFIGTSSTTGDPAGIKGGQTDN